MQVFVYESSVPLRWPCGGGYGKVSRSFLIAVVGSKFAVFVIFFPMLA